MCYIKQRFVYIFVNEMINERKSKIDDKLQIMSQNSSFLG